MIDTNLDRRSGQTATGERCLRRSATECKRCRVRAAAFVWVATVLAVTPCLAADGYFDPTWAGGGAIVFSGSGPWLVTHVVLQRNGNLAVAGHGGTSSDFFWLGELSPSGQFDAAFGSGGIVTSTDLGLYGANQDLDPSGLAPTSDGQYFVSSGVDADKLELVRIKADGTGTSGIANITSPGVLVNDAGGHVTANRALRLQPDGKLLAGGFGYSSDGDSVQKLGVIRLIPDAYGMSLDSAFNATTIGGAKYTGGNVVLASPGDVGAAVTDILLQADGRIVLVGRGSGAGGLDLEVARLNADGTLDTAFGAYGGANSVTPPASVGTFSGISPGSATIDRAGRILVATAVQKTGPLYMAVVRLTADGIPDSTFLGDGFATFSLSATCSSMDSNAVAVDSAGRVLVGGTCFESTGSDFIVVRFRGDGYLDGSFGINGHSLGAFSASNAYTGGLTMILDAGGRPIIAGDSGNLGGDVQPGIARLTYDLIYTNDLEFVPRGCLMPDCL
jgi:uncharacterized delta-60 repeat protein